MSETRRNDIAAILARAIIRCRPTRELLSPLPKPSDTPNTSPAEVVDAATAMERDQSEVSR